MTTHSRIGPSAAKRWLTCTGSIDLIQFLKSQEKIPERKSNPASELGTAVHYVCEQVLLGKRRVGDFRNIPIKEDGMTQPILLSAKNLEDARKYVNFCNGVFAISKGKMVVEETYDLSKRYDAPIGGTTDCTIVGDDGTLYVIDYKNGRIAVYAKDNPQTLIYALGAYYKYRNKMKKKLKKVSITIFQPNAADSQPDERTWTLSVRKLLRWEQNVLVPALEKIQSKKGVLVPSEEACFWCEAKPFCEAQKQNRPKLVKDLIVSSAIIPMLDTGSLPSPEELNEKELISVLQNADHVIEFYTACKKLGKKKLEDNKNALPGLGLRNNLGNRSFRSEELLTSALTDNNIDLDEVRVSPSSRMMNITELENYFKDDLEWEPKVIKEFMDSVTERKVSSQALCLVDTAENEFAEFAEPKLETKKPETKKRRKRKIR